MLHWQSKQERGNKRPNLRLLQVLQCYIKFVDEWKILPSRMNGILLPRSTTGKCRNFPSCIVWSASTMVILIVTHTGLGVMTCHVQSFLATSIVFLYLEKTLKISSCNQNHCTSATVVKSAERFLLTTRIKMSLDLQRNRNNMINCCIKGNKNKQKMKEPCPTIV